MYCHIVIHASMILSASPLLPGSTEDMKMLSRRDQQQQPPMD